MHIWLVENSDRQMDEMLTFNGILPNLLDQVVCDRLQFVRGSLLLLRCGVGADVCGVVDEDGAGVVVLLCDGLLQPDVGGRGVEHQADEENY